jgi:hypothetical protein
MTPAQCIVHIPRCHGILWLLGLAANSRLQNNEPSPCVLAGPKGKVEFSCLLASVDPFFRMEPKVFYLFYLSSYNSNSRDTQWTQWTGTFIDRHHEDIPWRRKQLIGAAELKPTICAGIRSAPAATKLVSSLSMVTHRLQIEKQHVNWTWSQTHSWGYAFLLGLFCAFRYSPFVWVAFMRWVFDSSVKRTLVPLVPEAWISHLVLFKSLNDSLL